MRFIAVTGDDEVGLCLVCAARPSTVVVHLEGRTYGWGVCGSEACAAAAVEGVLADG